MDVLDSLVIGAGQAGLSSSYHLLRRGVRHVVLDADPAPGGAWQHRWDSLTMADVHGVADLPGSQRPTAARSARANQVVPAYFAAYEREHHLPVRHRALVHRVTDAGGLLAIESAAGQWLSRTVINGTGTWRRPFVPHYRGQESFAGLQFHTVDYPGAAALAGLRVLVVGGGASAVQFLGELRPVTDTVWVTRRPPVWRSTGFDSEAGREAVALVADRVRRGLPPRSVVSVTGLMLRDQEALAQRLGAYHRLPMFDQIEPSGVSWHTGRFEPVDAILWATGFRADLAHLASLGLRGPGGGIQLGATAASSTTAVLDQRIQLVGYGPSASTIGANRAGRTAATAVLRYLQAGWDAPELAESSLMEPDLDAG